MIIDTWHNCYPSNWKGKIVSDAFQHPAKFSSKLIRAIYEHITAEGWVKPGDMVIDPFGGIALGALDAMSFGLSWYGCELEQHFAQIGNQNIDLWNRRFASMPGWSGNATLLQGDSRNLAEILAGAQVTVSSPPYAGMEVEKNSPRINLEKMYESYKKSGGGQTFEAFTNTQLKHSVNYQAVVSSPPFTDSLSSDRVDPAERVKLAREMGISNAADVSAIDMEKAGKRNQSYSAVVSSPPYADGCAHTGGNDSNPEHIQGGMLFGVGIAGAISSPPYADSDQDYKEGWSRFHDGHTPKQRVDQQREARYGESTGQLGAMKATDSAFQAAISSPPFAGSTADGGWQMLGKYAAEGKLTVKQVKGNTNKAYPSWNKDRNTDYAPSDDNLGNATATDAGFQAAVSSPPFQGTTGGTSVTAKDGVLADKRLFNRHAGSNAAMGYGESVGNLGNDLGNDFWLSARTIVEQVYQVLQPGGHAIWVVKDYVKNKQRVPFCDQWRELCEAVGFIALHEHHAMLIRHNGTSLTLDGGEVRHEISSKSFFRRLCEKKGSPEINWETVLCMEKK
jgi:hypothetical protein